MSEVRFSYIKLKNFKKYRDYEAVFSGNTIVVFGPNESGKSTLFEAIQTALFADAASSSKKLKDLANLATGEPPRIELGITVDGEEFTIVRDFVNKKNALIFRGSTYQNKNDIQRLIKELTGLDDRQLFEISFSIAQEQISIDSKGFTDAANRAVKQLVERFKVTPQELARKLGEKVNSIKRGLHSPAKNPGELKRTIEQINELQQRLVEVERQLEESRIAAEKAGALSEKISQLDQKLNQLEKQRNQLESARKHTEEYHDILSMSNLTEAIKQKGELESQLKKLEHELAHQQAQKTGLLQWMISAVEKQLAQAERKKEALKRFKELSEKLFQVNKIQKELNEIKAKIESLPHGLEQAARKCQGLLELIEGRTTTVTAKYGIELKQPDYPFVLKIDGKETEDALTGEFSEKFILETNQLKLETSLVGGKTTHELKQELERVLSEIGVKTVDELNEKLEEKRRLNTRLNMLKQQLDELPDEEELKSEIEKLKTRVSTTDEQAIDEEIRKLSEQKMRLEIQLPDGAQASAVPDLKQKTASFQEAEALLGKLKEEIEQASRYLNRVSNELEKVKDFIEEKQVTEIPDESR